MSAASDRVADAVLRLYPAPLRTEFGDEMRQWLHARWVAASTPLAVSRLGCVVLADLLRSWARATWHAGAARPARPTAWRSTVNVRHAWKSVRRRPWVSLSAVGILGAGLAFTVAALSIVRALLLAPYPYPALDRLALIRDGRLADGAHQGRSLPAGDLVSLERDARAFADVAIWRVQSVVLGDTHGDTPEAFEGLAVAPNFFRVLGVTARLGRTFSPGGIGPASTDEVVVSDRLWRARFASNPDVVGSTVLVNSRPAVLIGVIPDAAGYPAGVDVWTPLALSPADAADHAAPRFRAVARLADKWTLHAAQVDAARVAAGLAASFPATNRGRGFDVSELRAEQYEFTAAPFLLVQVSALLVLGLAIVNVAGVLTASAGERVREFAVRRALGASRASLFAGMLLEAACVTFAAGAFGLGLAAVMTTGIRQLLPDGISRWFAGWSAIALDGSVVTAGVSLTVVTAVLIGATTGVRAVRLSAAAGLRASGRSSVGHVSLTTRAIVVAQIALAMALVVCGGLVVGGFQRIARDFDGSDPSHDIIVRVTRPAAASPDALIDFHQRLETGLRALPGVVAVGVIQNHPASNVPCPTVTIAVDGRPAPPPNDRFHADLQTVSPGALQALGVSLRRGRLLRPADRPGSERVAVISESMADALWPGRDAVGARMQIGSDTEPWTSVVGIVSDLKVNWYDADRRPTVYVPFAQSPINDVYVVVRAAGDTAPVAAAARLVIHDVDPMQPMALPRALVDEVRDSITPIRALSLLLSIAGVVAVVLAAAGIYAAIASAVVARRREFGLRLALGATRSAVGWLMLGRALRFAIVGVALGAPCAIVAAAALRQSLFGVAALSPLVVILSGLGLMLVAAAAALRPSLSATRTDPAVLLQSD